MTALFLPRRIDAAEAARLFVRPRFGNLYGLWRSRPVKRTPGGEPASLELLWMPAYAFRLALSKGNIRSATWVSVDASYGGFALFERAGLLEEKPEDEGCVPPVHDEAAAESLARQGLLRYLLRRRGVKPLIETTLETRFYYAPVWAYYFYRSGRKIDLAVIDGYTGIPMGGQMRAAIVNAFIRQRKTDGSPA